MKTYNKLVRDLIPDIIKNNGGLPKIKELDEEEYSQALLHKLKEEVAEFEQDNNLEELADIIEVVDALSQKLGASFDDVIKIKQAKQLSRGGFKQRIFLERVDE